MLKTKLLSSAAGVALAATAALGFMGTTSAQAAPVACPVIVDHTGNGGSNGCTVLLTINPNGSVTASNPSGVSTYDGSDDALIGIVNNTSQTLNHFFIIGSTAFGGSFGGMDGDGVCDTARFSGAACSTSQTTGNLNYAPDGVTLTEVTASTGFVDFAGGLAGNGGTGYFSLEAPASINGITLSVPEPSSLAILGFALAGLGLLRRRRRAL